MTTIQWVAVEARTGKVIADLPLLSCPRVRRSIGRYETATATLPIAVGSTPENWLDATQPGAANLILLQDDLPIWGGMVLRRNRGVGDTVELTVATLESYFDRRFVGDVTYTSTGQNTIASGLVTSYIAAGVNGGLPIRVEVLGGAGTLRDRTYADRDDRTVYSALTDLMGVDGGPEWTVEWEWQHSPERITPVFRVAARIGVAPMLGLFPAATFEYPGQVSIVSLADDFSSNKGANSVVAVTTAQGDVRPQSPAQVRVDGSRPTFEYRWTPSTSITVVDTLTAHAVSALDVLGSGTSSLSLTAVVQDAPKLGVDWSIGDDIGFKLGGIDQAGNETADAFPGGMSGVARAVGWEYEPDGIGYVTPILAGTEV